MSEEDTKEQAVAPAAPADIAGDHHELRKVMDFVESHGIKLLIGVAAVAVATISLNLYRRHQDKRNAEAASMLFSVNSVQDLDNLTARYSSTPIAPLAELKLAKSYFESGSYEMAAGKYDEFARQQPQHPLAPAAAAGRLHCLEAMGQVEQALAGYEAFLKEHPKSFMAAQVVFGKGRCLEHLNRFADAKAMYEDFIAVAPKGPWVARAEEQLAILKRKLGEGGETAQAASATAVTNAPAAPAQ